MSLQPLDKKIRKQLENTIIKARNVAEAAARTALERLCVGDGKPGEHLTEAMRQQRNKLRAHGRQLGDSRKDNAEQTIDHLVQETAYEQWHRMLFARFLAENSLLIYEDGVTPLSIQDCFELAEDEAGVNGWELAGRYASAMLPQIFRTENPVLTIHFSPEHQRELEKLLEVLEAETFQASDSLGWVYQYWQAQKKDEVNKSGNKIGADELSAVTQLFTEPYMVSFLLDNSLGAWWVSHYPQYKDLLPFQYLRYASEQLDVEHTEYKETTIPAAGTFEQWPKALSELKMLDPCCGSGHFLVATLLMLVPMRMKAEGLTADEAISRVLAENIHGLELDQRFVEIAVFAVALEAWRYPESSGFRSLPSLNIAWVGQSIKAKKEDWLSLAGNDERLYYGMEALYNTFKDAPILGSLIDPSKSIPSDLLNDGFAELQPLFNKALQQFEVAENLEAAIAAKGLTLAADLLNQKYKFITTNVPYLSWGKQCQVLQDYSDRYYRNAKNDLANVFLERCLELNTIGGVTQLVMPQNWLFLGAYQKQREHLLKNATWSFLIRLGGGAEAFRDGPGNITNISLFIFTLLKPKKDHVIYAQDANKPKTIEEKIRFLKNSQLSAISQKCQLDNPDARITFEVNQVSTLLNEYSICIEGISTGDIPQFVQKFWEINNFEKWAPFIQNAPKTEYFCGRSDFILWENDNGRLRKSSTAHNFPSEIMNGYRVLGNIGLRITQMGDLRVTLYTGEVFGKNGGTLILKDNSHLPAVWAFCSSPEYNSHVRQIDQKISVTVGSMIKVGSM